MPALQKFSSEQIKSFCQLNGIEFSPFKKNYQQAYYPLIKQILKWQTNKAKSSSPIIGLNAPQGAGKSTLVNLIKQVIKFEQGLETVVLSIDDFYMSRSERGLLANKIHPLLMTRGVPGAHDIELAIKTVASLKNRNVTAIPRFNKATDERLSFDQWDQLTKPVDFILLEGWCLGALPQNNSQLKIPTNQLERLEDESGIWRNYVNQQLADKYQSLFSMVNHWIKLSAPSFDTVCRWRKQQEEKLNCVTNRLNLPNSKVMNSQALKRFMMHFERLTRHIQESNNLSTNFELVLDEARNASLK